MPPCLRGVSYSITDGAEKKDGTCLSEEKRTFGAKLAPQTYFFLIFGCDMRSKML